MEHGVWLFWFAYFISSSRLFFSFSISFLWGSAVVIKRVVSIELDFHEAAVSVHPHDSTADVERIFGTVRPKPGTPGALPVLVPQGPTKGFSLVPGADPHPAPLELMIVS